IWLTLTPTRNARDLPVLARQFLLTPADKVTATTLAHLCLDRNQTAGAQQVLALARLYHPRDAALWELSLKAARTNHHEEQIYRQMTREFPDEPKHALALARTLLD